ncbi:Avirulence (Avh) protein [Phytophthora megakarya]|uniref:Avirulence (Avh) protein n=1 Tax=Phytophthora megakarya TaxID=4795 RepID=A0A225WVD2_9STRA|nr:Avirulence (Avh) protein [Phytophthora megakarya]
MRLHHVFLIAFAIMVNITVGFPSHIVSKLPTFFADEQVIFAKRFLRTASDVIEENEERAPQLPISKIESLKSLTTPATIPDDMFNRWVKKKKSVDKVFIRLSLNKNEEKLLNNPHFATWINYVKALDAATGGPSWTAISKLTKYYGDRDVAKIIEAAKKKPGMEKIADDLHAQQFQYWLSRYITDTPHYVFRSLALPFDDYKSLKNPLFLSWIDYVNFFNKNRSPKHQEGFLATLGTKYMYNDKGISKLVKVAMKKPNTMDFGKKLRAEQIERSLANGVSPTDVWGYLKYDVVGGKVFDSPNFKTLATYVDRFNTKNPGKKTALASVIMNHYYTNDPTNVLINVLKSKKPGTEQVVKQVEIEVFNIWEKTDVDPSLAFVKLALHETPSELFSNPLFNTWTAYVNVLNAKNPNTRTEVIDVLRARFGDSTLSKLLVEAKAVPSSKDLATKLEASLLAKMTTEGKPPVNVN